MKFTAESVGFDRFNFYLYDFVLFYLDPLIKVCGLKDAVLQAKEKIMCTLNTKVSFMMLLFSGATFKFLMRVSLN